MEFNEEITLNLILDKISVTMHEHDEEQQKGIKHHFYDNKKLSTEYIQAKPKGSRYKINQLLFTPGGGQVLFQADPYVLKQPFVRLEWNPSKLGPEGHIRLKHECDLHFMSGYYGLKKYGRVTRADVALDIRGVNVNDVQFVPVRPLRTISYQNVKGRTETIYLGKSTSRRQWRIYDKRLEQKLPPGVEITRVERVIKTGIALETVPTLKNPFVDLTICGLDSANAPPKTEKWVWGQFQDACRYRGANAVLARMPKAIRAKYRGALRAASTDWWDPDLIWEQWPVMLDDIGLLELHHG